MSELVKYSPPTILRDTNMTLHVNIALKQCLAIARICEEVEKGGRKTSSNQILFFDSLQRFANRKYTHSQ